jgi:hypothetical protein
MAEDSPLAEIIDMNAQKILHIINAFQRSASVVVQKSLRPFIFGCGLPLELKRQDMPDALQSKLISLYLIQNNQLSGQMLVLLDFKDLVLIEIFFFVDANLRFLKKSSKAFSSSKDKTS